MDLSNVLEESSAVTCDVLEKFWMEHPHVEMIHLHWVDFSGILRARILPKRSLLARVREGRPFSGGAWANVGLMEVEGLPAHCMPASRMGLYPDWSSLRSMGKGHASVMCNTWEENGAFQDLSESHRFDRCPRSALQTAISALETQQSVQLLLGIEIEFYLVDHSHATSSPKLRPTAECNFGSLASSVRGWPERIMTEIALCLERSGIPVEQWQAESGPQQFEISLSPMAVLAAADSYVLAKEMIARVARTHDMMAMFLPKPFDGLPASGLHAHVSFTGPAGSGMMVQAEHDSKMESFVAGILTKQRVLCAFSMPTTQSYSRIREWVLGEWVCWGTENRDAPVRKISDNHWEFRAMDSTANVYLALAAYLAAGLVGIEHREALGGGDWCDYQRRLSEQARKDFKIFDRLPGSLDEATALLSSDEVKDLQTVISPKLLDWYRTAKRQEQLSLSRMSAENRSALYLTAY